MEQTIQLDPAEFTGLCFVNLVDFDAPGGHRRDPLGYAAELERPDLLQPFLPRRQRQTCSASMADHGTTLSTRGRTIPGDGPSVGLVTCHDQKRIPAGPGDLCRPGRQWRENFSTCQLPGPSRPFHSGAVLKALFSPVGRSFHSLKTAKKFLFAAVLFFSKAVNESHLYRAVQICL